MGSDRIVFHVICIKFLGGFPAKKRDIFSTRDQTNVRFSCLDMSCLFQCSTDCGKGLQQRVVICMKSVRGNYQETFDAGCSLDDKPAVRKDCNSDCAPSWFATPWTQVGI